MSSSENPFNIPSFRSELSDVLDEKLKPIADLLEKHDAKLEAHEAALQRAKGAAWAWKVVWVGLVAAVDWAIHVFGSGHKP